MEDYIKLAEFLFQQSTIVQITISVLVTVMLAYKYIIIKEYILKRRNDSINRTLAYGESQLKGVLNDSLSKFRHIFMNIGPLTQEDRTELSLLRFALSNSLLVESKAIIKSMVFVNSYIAKIRNNISYADIIEARASEIYNLNVACLESIIRSSSPVNGQIGIVYNEAKVLELLKELVLTHNSEVLIEEAECNDFIKSNLGLLAKFWCYKH